MIEHDSTLRYARRQFALIADRVTEYLLGEQTLRAANETLVLIREQAQDAAEATLDKVETRT